MSYRDRKPTIITLTGPEMVETNAEHAELVRPLYEGFADCCYGDWQGEAEANPNTILGDLIGDLLHLATAIGADPDEVIRLGQYHHQCEVDEAAPRAPDRAMTEALAHDIETKSMGPPCSASPEDWVRWGEGYINYSLDDLAREQIADVVEAVAQESVDSLPLAVLILMLIHKVAS